MSFSHYNSNRKPHAQIFHAILKFHWGFTNESWISTIHLLFHASKLPISHFPHDSLLSATKQQRLSGCSFADRIVLCATQTEAHYLLSTMLANYKNADHTKFHTSSFFPYTCPWSISLFTFVSWSKKPCCCFRRVRATGATFQPFIPVVKEPLPDYSLLRDTRYTCTVHLRRQTYTRRSRKISRHRASPQYLEEEKHCPSLYIYEWRGCLLS